MRKFVPWWLYIDAKRRTCLLVLLKRSCQYAHQEISAEKSSDETPKLMRLVLYMCIEIREKMIGIRLDVQQQKTLLHDYTWCLMGTLASIKVVGVKEK